MNSLFSQFDLELDKALDVIKTNEAKRVLLHLPDGIKPKAAEMIDYFEKELGDECPEILVWAGSCYGACDLPVEAKNVGVDLMLHWGHSRWKF